MKNKDRKKSFLIVISIAFFLSASLLSIAFSGLGEAAMEESDVVSVSATVPPTGTGIFSGRACPSCRVYVKINGVLDSSAICQNNANFQITVNNIATGTYLFDFYAIDTEGIRTSTLSITDSVSQGAITSVSNILLSPTLRSNKNTVIKGEEITFFGQTVPNRTVTIVIDGSSPFIQVNSAPDGGFYYVFNSTSLGFGTHSVEARVSSGGNLSSYSLPVNFSVIEKEEDEEDEEEDDNNKCSLIADYNCDQRVDLIDFSILMYWFEKGKFPAKIDLNNDNKINILEFSIMMHYWTG